MILLKINAARFNVFYLGPWCPIVCTVVIFEMRVEKDTIAFCIFHNIADIVQNLDSKSDVYSILFKKNNIFKSLPWYARTISWHFKCHLKKVL